MVLSQAVKSGDVVLFEAGSIIRPSTLHLLRQRHIRRVQILDYQEISPEIRSKVSKTFRESIVVSTGTVLDRIRHRIDLSRNVVESTVNQVVELIGFDSRAMLNLYHANDVDGFLYPHAINTTVLSVILAEKLGFDDEEILAAGMGALLHDVGMFSLPPDVIFKDGPLSKDDWILVKEHPDRGVEEVSRLEGIHASSIRAIRQHQERMDGSGYPLGLSGDSIDPISRLVMICDVYDAMISSRPWRKRIGMERDTLRMMVNHSTGRLDPDMMQEFIKIIPFFPPGIRVELSNGQFARVVGLSDNPFRPIIELLDRDNQPSGVEIDLSATRYFRMFIRQVMDNSGASPDESGKLE